MHNIRYIIWDFDGTLHDTYPPIARAVNSALAHFGHVASLDRVIELTSLSLDYCIAELAKDYHIDQYMLDTVFTETYKAVSPQEQGPFDHVQDVCQYVLERGGANYLVTHRQTPSLFHLLELHAMHHYFADIIAGDAGFPKKPDPAAFNHLLQKHTLPKKEVLVIGDRDIDILAAHHAGVASCLFRGTCTTIRPTYAINHFLTLYQLLHWS